MGDRPCRRDSSGGRTLAERRIDLVYGGARIGTMGVVAETALAAGGTVIGMILQGLNVGRRGNTGEGHSPDRPQAVAVLARCCAELPELHCRKGSP